MTLETTTLDRRWLAKMIIFFAVLVFFGFYGLYDAIIAYPNRGFRHASYCEFQYLEAARSQGLLDRRLIIENPREEYARLRALEPSRLGEIDKVRLEWLRSLSVVGALKPEFTQLAVEEADGTVRSDPQARYEQLKQEWTTTQGTGKNAPKALASYDIPVQWLFVVIGFGGGAWMAGLFIAVKRIRYSWDAEKQVLHLPIGGVEHTLTPADIEEFDKRKWDKYLVFLKIKPEHPTLGGREIKLDLYRYAHLETWILAMEKTAFPENQTPAAEDGGQPESEEHKVA